MRATTKIIGPGKHDFIQSLAQKRHAKTAEGRLMSAKQKSEISQAKHPYSKFVFHNNIRNFSASRHITN